MKISNKTITLRASELSPKCMRSIVLKLKSIIDGTLDETPSEAAKLGTDTHSLVESILNDKALPNNVSQEAISLLTRECSVEGIAVPSTHILNIGRENLFDDVKVPCFDTQENALSFLREKKILCKRDPFDRYSVRAYSFKKNEGIFYTSIYDVIHKNLFGKPLEKIEVPVSYNILHKGFTFEVTGRVDSMSEDGNLIVDWKTASSSPVDGFRNIQYTFQQGIYRNILIKENKPLTNSYVVLGYIVKTKTPKFKPIAFPITEHFIREMDIFIYQILENISAFLTHGVIPFYSLGEFCDWCNVKGQCMGLNSISPCTVSVGALLV